MHKSPKLKFFEHFTSLIAPLSGYNHQRKYFAFLNCHQFGKLPFPKWNQTGVTPEKNSRAREISK